MNQIPNDSANLRHRGYLAIRII